MIAQLFALLAGAATVFAFAPFRLWALPAITLAALFRLWSEAGSTKRAARLGFAFGLGLFGAGVSWVSIALHVYGEMPLPIAAVAPAVFCAYLALFPAFAGAVSWWLAARTRAPAEWIAASAWTLAEWGRSWFLSGFPWLSIGHSQVPDSPLGGFSVVGGTFATTLAVAMGAALVARALRLPQAPDGALGGSRGRALARRLVAAAAALAFMLAAGGALRGVEWTRPAGASLTVSLVQGNVRQEIKFDPAFRSRTLAIYRSLIESARGRLVILPESAMPMFAHEMPDDYARFLIDSAMRAKGDVLFGIFTFSAEDGGQYHNSVIAVGAAGVRVYRKRHLVPFGETIPLKSVVGWFIDEVLKIPLADQTPGPADQPPIEAAGERLAVGICYEDAFGAELIGQLPEATLLVNVSNDAWYGRSIAAEQHHQIAQSRAFETGRWMLRSTQTGITALVDHRGREVARLPWFEPGVLEGTVQGREGATPYVRGGDLPAVFASLALLAALIAVAPKRRP